MIAGDRSERDSTHGEESHQKQSFLTRVFATAGRFIYDVLVAHFPTVFVSVTALLGYTWQVQEGNVPGPADIIEEFRGDSSSSTRRPAGVVSIDVQADDSRAGELAQRIHQDVVGAVQPVSAKLAGLRIVWGLGDLRSSTGSANTVSVRWAMRTNAHGWVECRSEGMRFAKVDNLPRFVASHINNSLTASENAGELLCS